MIGQYVTNGQSVPEVVQDMAGDIEEPGRSEFLLAKTEVAGTAKASRTVGAGIVLVLLASAKRSVVQLSNVLGRILGDHVRTLEAVRCSESR